MNKLQQKFFGTLRLSSFLFPSITQYKDLHGSTIQLINNNEEISIHIIYTVHHNGHLPNKKKWTLAGMFGLRTPTQFATATKPA